jgi:hypothetical protein
MAEPGNVISYTEMCAEVAVNLQRGMNFRLRDNISVILMSIRKGAPYADRVEDGGRTLVYEGHDVAQVSAGPDPKTVDQPETYASGRLTQNGLFREAAESFKRGAPHAELVKVFEKLHRGIWVYNGLFKLVDAWQETIDARRVFKFKLELTETPSKDIGNHKSLEHDRIIPSLVKLEVWKRDKGQCVKCGSRENLHFDHIIPYSQGGSSKDARNIQILCLKHNLAKRDRIE